MRVLPAEPGEVCVLARDDTKAREEAPLALRFMIDTSVVSPTEAIEFAEFLTKSTLFIEVWDANSLLLIGQCGIPLRRLMRQGHSTVKCAMECDVIDSESVMEIDQGITTMVMSDGGPVAGDVVGALQVIMCNYGRKGRGTLAPTSAANKVGSRALDADHHGLNWRAMGIEPMYGDPAPGKGKSRGTRCVHVHLLRVLLSCPKHLKNTDNVVPQTDPLRYPYLHSEALMACTR